MDLSKLSFSELQALQDQIKQELSKREKEEVAKAREQILAIAKHVGIPLKELMGDQVRGKTGKTTGKVAVRYRHPSDASLQWTGRGRQPQWVKEWVASGKAMDTLSV